MWQIRAATVADNAALAAVTTAAFLTAPHSDGNEAAIIAGLRQAGALSLALVAQVQEQLAGGVCVSPVALSSGAENWYGLGPLAVAPAYQCQGIGAALVEQVLAQLTALGAAGCVVLGDPAYYARFGFASHPALCLPGVPPEYFMAKLLKPQGAAPLSALSPSAVSYHRAFYPALGD
ncbi:MAG: GNAT family N-acetyltransferase [Aeromonas sp.]